MFLITGGLGKIGTIIRNEVERLKDAKVFDIGVSEEQNILHREAIQNELKNQQYEGVVHLAEMGQPLLEKRPIQDREIFNVNIRGIKNLIDLLRFSDKKIIYTIEMNKSLGYYNRAKHLNVNRLLAHRVSATILPLPEILPKAKADRPVTPKDLFDLLLKFALLENNIYVIDRGPEDIIYLGTEEMVAMAFEDTIQKLNSLSGEIAHNDFFIGIKTKNFIDMLKRHFPDTVIVAQSQTQTVEEPELFVNKLEEYFTSLPISALYAPKMDAVELIDDLKNTSSE